LAKPAPRGTRGDGTVMLETNEILVIALLVSFIGLIFTGFPVAWALAGISVLFSFLAIWGYETWAGTPISSPTCGSSG
jgi:hypothetical protein